MAITVASSSTQYSASGTSLTITKPTGLAVGDLMLAGIRHDNGDGCTNPSGWTNLSTAFGVFNNLRLCYKYADSGDAAASNFTWTLGSSAISAGGMLRITGASPLIGSAVLQVDQSNQASPSFATGVTPTRANSLIAMFIFSVSNSNNASSGYAITTSDPGGWTEAYDTTMESSTNMACAWVVRPQTTSTGAWSCTGGTGATDWGSFLISINEALTISVTETVTLTEAHKQNLTILKAESVTLTEDYDVDKDTMWTNQSKSSSDTWTNQTKSS